VNEELEVWAPKAREVAIEQAGERVTPRALGDGHYRAPAPRPGEDYFIVLDGQRRPDPRSCWQPHGVHGASQRIDHGAFAWIDRSFRAPPLASGLVYELHVGTFTAEGTYAAAATRLPYLADLGVTHVELMPLATFPGRYGWGYDGVCLFAPHPAYGTPDELKRFVARAHELGLAVLLDVVYNHLGPDGNYLAEFGPYFTDRFQTPWGPAVNLDGPHSDHVRRFLIDNACMWLRDYHFDGLRLDAVHAFMDGSARTFLEQLTAEVRWLETRLQRPLVLIAESDLNDPRIVRSVEAGGYGLDAQWSDDLHHALHALLTGEKGGYYADFGALADIGHALREGFVYGGRYSRHRQRMHGRSLGELSGHRLLGYLQTHDQIGNRARGERIAMLASPGRVRIGAALVFIAPFVPMIFQGEEWAASTPFCYFADHKGEPLARAVREGRRSEFAAFGWRPEDIPDPLAEATFRGSVLRWQETLSEPHASMLAFYSALIGLRASTPELLDGRRDRVEVQWDELQGWLRVHRGPITLLANIGEHAVDLPRPEGRCVLAYPTELREHITGVTLLPDACAIWRA
jgi:maltooligosyltrehalose trehalohydrolase